MHTKVILVSCGHSLTPERASAVFAFMDADVRILKVPLSQALSSSHVSEADLIVVEDSDGSYDATSFDKAFSDDHHVSVLVVVDETKIESLRLPARLASDFVCSHSPDEEIKLRCRRLLWPGEATSDVDFVHEGPLTINLATYQVKVNGDPVDLTFMEYSLLSFLVTHPGRIYSREVLLSQVWGFDYYGGSRTVDVHVRRLRAKLGAEVAQHLETVRGAGYLWQS